MLDMGIRSGVHRFAVGSDWGTPISESNINYTITDSQEVNKLFWDVVKKFYPSAELIFIDQRHEVRSVHSSVVRRGGENATVGSEKKNRQNISAKAKKTEVIKRC